MNAPDPLHAAIESIFDIRLRRNINAAQVAGREYVFVRIPLALAVSIRRLLRDCNRPTL